VNHGDRSKRLRMDLVSYKQPGGCTMARDSRFRFSSQCLKFKDRRPIRIEFLQQETVLYREL